MIAYTHKEWDNEGDNEGYLSTEDTDIEIYECRVEGNFIHLEAAAKHNGKAIASIDFVWRPNMDVLTDLMAMGVKQVNKAKSVLEGMTE